MQLSIRKFAALAAVLLAAGVLAGCAGVSKNIAADGSSAQKLVWLKPSEANPLHRRGTLPNIDNLRQIQSGLDKEQIVGLIGIPHFGEAFGQREWNYLFNFRKDGEVVQCEYKILFDQNEIARSFYWHPASCKDFLGQPPEPIAQTFTLSGDALFAFNKSGLHDITSKGVSELSDLAGKLTAPGVKLDSVQVTGYTDKIGSDAYNDRLSRARANTVRAFLVEKGVPADEVTAVGKGEADPVKTDCGALPRAQLIACLAPNRRVVISVKGSRIQ